MREWLKRSYRGRNLLEGGSKIQQKVHIGELDGEWLEIASALLSHTSPHARLFSHQTLPLNTSRQIPSPLYHPRHPPRFALVNCKGFCRDNICGVSPIESRPPFYVAFLPTTSYLSSSRAFLSASGTSLQLQLQLLTTPVRGFVFFFFFRGGGGGIGS